MTEIDLLKDILFCARVIMGALCFIATLLALEEFKK